MKLGKKVIKKKNKKNKKKQKKIINQNVELVTERIVSTLDKVDQKYIKNITTILTPKVALRIFNQASDVEDSGGINDPLIPSRRLTKLESFLHLIENDTSISKNKKNQIRDSNSSLPPSTPKISKRKQKQTKRKVKDIQSELNKLCLTQLKNELNRASNNQNSNYFAIESLNKLNDSNKDASNLIKPSKFNLNLNAGMPIITPNDKTLLSRPKLDLNRLNLESNSSVGSVMGNLQLTNKLYNGVNAKLDGNYFQNGHQTIRTLTEQNSQLNNIKNDDPGNPISNNLLVNTPNTDRNNIQINLQVGHVQNNHTTVNNSQINHHDASSHNSANQPTISIASTPISAQIEPSKFSVASLFRSG